MPVASPNNVTSKVSETHKKKTMLNTCPNCRHSYQNELPSACPPCYLDKVHRTKPPSFSRVNFAPDCAAGDTPSKQKQQWAREKSGHIRASKDSGRSSATPVPLILPPPASLFSSCDAFRVHDEKTSNSFFTSEDDLRRIAESQEILKLSGWYHEKLSWNSAIKLLMPTEVGTFLVRDSSDPRYLYSLSVQAKCGPISIRIHYSAGEFRLDADVAMAKYMPKFPCIVELIQHYVESTERLPLQCEHEDENQNWINVIGRIYSNIVLTKPLYAKNQIPSLKHLSRLCVNRNLLNPNFITVLPTPSFVIDYMKQYPYKC